MKTAGNRPTLRSTKRRGRLPAGLATLVGALLLLPSSAFSGTVTGHARFQGSPPERPTMYMTADPACDKVSPKGRASEMVVVDASGGLANVLVYVKTGLEDDATWPMPTASARIDQTGCAYVPHVIGLRAGQELEVHSSDPTLHNVNARTASNTPFNEAMLGAGTVLRKSFAQPEVAVKLKCDIHPWMSAYVGVFAHPYFSVTSVDGAFSLPALPEGEYVLEAWHESLGTRSAKVEVDDDGVATVNFSFAGN